ncbi:hypothetical protein WJX72_012023 [[Myrmecia] bisecta]|uniref:Uracil-DNA glycosylase-like domain-containing protein n=1 Tax=[Myrmecia] bisecta TaxID=41462 RepID=A0AAW1Q6L0_9CHLO
MSSNLFSAFSFAKRETNKFATGQAATGAQLGAKPKRKAVKERKKLCLDNAVGVPENLGDWPLRLIIVGTNPSEHAWLTGHSYSHPANWMWRILKGTGIAPPSIRGAQDCLRMPGDAGVGFLDVGCGHPGTVLSEFSSATFAEWSVAFYARLTAHLQRAAMNAGCACGQCAAPPFVGFAGKRQWCELVNIGRKGKDKITKVDCGPQSERPAGWPFPPGTAVWVLPSTSGASPQTNAERFGPYQQLSDQLRLVNWPRQISCQAPG